MAGAALGGAARERGGAAALIEPRHPELALRPARDDDLPLLQEIYASTRAAELEQTGWGTAERERFIAWQFAAQHQAYTEGHPEGFFGVIERDARPIGRLYLAHVDGQVRILDIALLPTEQGRGLGTSIITDVMAYADRLGAPVTLHVERWNPAQRLYGRLGFSVVGENEVYLLLERKPSDAAQLNTDS